MTPDDLAAIRAREAVIDAARAEYLHRHDPDSHWLDELHDAVRALDG